MTPGAAAGSKAQEITERRPNREIRKYKDVGVSGGVGGGMAGRAERGVRAGGGTRGAKGARGGA